MSSYSLNGSWIDGSPRIRSSSLIRRSAPPPPPHRRALLRELSNAPDSSDSSFKNEKYKRSQRKSETKSTTHTSKTYTGPRYRSHGDLHNWTPSTAHPTAVQLMRIKQQWKNDYEPGFERLEKLQKEKMLLRKDLKK